MVEARSLNGLEKTSLSESTLEVIKNGIFIIYILLIFEGALRKWILPQLSSPLFFIKDPLVFYIYYKAFIHRLFPRTRELKLTYFLMVLFLILGIFQSVMNQVHPIVILYGLRNYFMLVPLAYLIAEYFGIKDLIKIARITCLIGLPTAILIYFQYHSSPEAFINKNVGVGETTRVFTIAKDIVRTSGFFSFSTGHSLYVQTLVACLFFNFFLPKHLKFINRYLSLIIWGAAAMCIVYSGSRGLIAELLIFAFILIFYSFISINSKSSFKVIGTLVLVSIIGLFLANTFFADSVSIFQDRFERAASHENTIFRFFAQYIEFYRPLGNMDIPTWGAGLGFGSGGGSFLATGQRSLTLAEGDWPRIMGEAGVLFGFIYILFRTYMATFSLYKSFSAFSISKSPAAVVFSACIFMTMLGGQITKQGTELYYAWLFIGFAMAANRVFSDPDKSWKISFQQEA